MSSKSEIFIHEFVVGFGFLGGLFTRVGVDPETEMVKGLLEVARAFYPSIGPMIPWITLLCIILLTVLPIAGAYKIGGFIGLGAVGSAWAGGFLMVGGSTQTILGFAFLLVGMFAGSFASDSYK